jgi:hypothetical protein
MRGVMASLILRMRMGSMRMGQGAGVMGQSRTPNGDRLTVFPTQQDDVRISEEDRVLIPCPSLPTINNNE